MKEDKFSIWSDGYYARRIAAGDRPDYSLPKTSLPIPTIEEMEIESCYLAALKKEKEMADAVDTQSGLIS